MVLARLYLAFQYCDSILFNKDEKGVFQTQSAERQQVQGTL